MDFTFDEYRALIALALDRGYRFSSFDQLERGENLPVRRIFLRHDIDYGPRFMVDMATIEGDCRVCATYCIQLDSPWYDVASADNRAAVRAALAHGHHLGLHFDATRLESDEEVRAGVEEHVHRLSSLFETPVRTVSFHMPGRRPVGHLELPGDLINTYGPPLSTEVGYVSDSNQSWRGRDVREIIASDRHDRLQLLVHPFWWRTTTSTLREKMSALANELDIEINEIVTPEQWAEMEAQESGLDRDR
jgi:hypothetical protein